MVLYLNPLDDGKKREYRNQELPSKLKVWYKYALNFTKTLYKKTAFISIAYSKKTDSENREAMFEPFKTLNFDMFYNYEIMDQVILALLGIQR